MPTVTVPLRPGSDGDYTHKPPDKSTWTIIDPPTLYLERVGLQWMQDRDEAKPGIKYVLEKLPVGYTLYQRPRANGTKDKYLFGHPNHKYFDSPNRFYPHFKHLIENGGNSMACPCTVCDPRGGVLPGKPPSTSGHFSMSSSSTSGPSSRRISITIPSKEETTSQPVQSIDVGASAKVSLGRPKMTLTGMDATRVDEEGTPDIYRNLIDRLKCHGKLDESIKEPLSLDWRAEQEVIPDLMKKVQRDPQWIPRIGDILLYVRNVPEGIQIVQDPQTGEYVLYDPQSNDFGEKAMWEAGLVCQVPAVQEPSGGEEQWCISQTGVRMEPVPNPNDTKKALSKRYTYVPVEHTRPFCLCEDYIGYVPQDKRHPTIQNAFTVSATMSLMGKHRFHGTWPTAYIHCHAIYIGSELIAVGDTVRLAPKAGDENVIADVLVVKTIRLRLSNLDNASTNDYDEGRPYNSEIWIYGSGFTTTALRTSKEWLSQSNTKIPKSASGYGAWFPLHPSNKELAVPFSRIIGRLYERDALESWFSDPDLDSGREGVLDARHFASSHDKRIVSNVGTTWFWADSRADALDLHTINGIDVGKNDIQRDPRDWHKSIKAMEAGAAFSDRRLVPQVRSLRGFLAPGTSIEHEKGSTSSSSAMTGSKRRVIEVSDDDEEEIRRQTRIVTNVPYRRSKIQVVVD
ncbi:hypothetical protein PMIN02_007905 [Paraphaeosphaeria minitans]|uniref:Cryptic loci regulator 2 N-terminal domain-containing protein n=1 Tax=Paraphaeosphaeria minitans TaxID=565426 RepID=A0A9P6KLS4_9PLEO|nr:hypothetical protein PMIN01_11099 [Paraphaeosphaeria minitans]